MEKILDDLVLVSLVLLTIKFDNQNSKMLPNLVLVSLVLLTRKFGKITIFLYYESLNLPVISEDKIFLSMSPRHQSRLIELFTSSKAQFRGKAKDQNVDQNIDSNIELLTPAIPSTAHPPEMFSPAPPPPSLPPPSPLVEQQAGGRDAPPEILGEKSVARNFAGQVTKSEVARARASRRDGVSSLFLDVCSWTTHVASRSGTLANHEELPIKNLKLELVRLSMLRGYRSPVLPKMPRRKKKEGESEQSVQGTSEPRDTHSVSLCAYTRRAWHEPQYGSVDVSPTSRLRLAVSRPRSSLAGAMNVVVVLVGRQRDIRVLETARGSEPRLPVPSHEQRD
ncbi:hypothetical protein EAG_03032 [Camponotus floridanus]|uniref:Uncharacterized protein n=1 Tax=Camponotus floridanus TaxID=104421 RepID=E2A540_CAMFO|nr:hypothetical protein EAG_03032 [Camponotus floridanus]